jgi:hypothetical protein
LPLHRYPGYEGATHRGGHTDAYVTEVFERLELATNREGAIRILDGIRNDLLNGNLLVHMPQEIGEIGGQPSVKRGFVPTTCCGD